MTGHPDPAHACKGPQVSPGPSARTALSGLVRLFAGLGFGVGVGIALTWTEGVQAATGDQAAQAIINSDRLDYDDRAGLTVFTGNVSLVKGTLVLRGLRMTLKQISAQEIEVVVIGGPGKPAEFRQASNSPSDLVQGMAQQIQYNSRTEVAMLTQQALIKRYQGDRLVDEIRGDALRYDNLSERYAVVDGPTGPMPPRPPAPSASPTPSAQPAPSAPPTKLILLPQDPSSRP